MADKDFPRVGDIWVLKEPRDGWSLKMINESQWDKVVVEDVESDVPGMITAITITGNIFQFSTGGFTYHYRLLK